VKWNLQAAAEIAGATSVRFHKLKAITPARSADGSFVLQLDATRMDLSEAALLALQDREGGSSALLSAYLMSEVFGAGPKLFKLGGVDFEALEATDVNVQVADYNQPFPTIVFEYPEGYISKRQVPCEQAGQLCEAVGAFPEEHAPSFCVVHHLKELGFLVAGLYCTSSQIYIANVSGRSETIEDCLTLYSGADFVYDRSAQTNDAEKAMFRMAIRAAFNAALLLNQFGCRRIGPENPAHFARLQRQAYSARKTDAERKERAELALRLHPTVYEFDQQVLLRKAMHADATAAREGGWTVTPHHRRGHYRTINGVPYWVRPAFVNARLFSGELSSTSTTYRN
jgi:hypothetical protein